MGLGGRYGIEYYFSLWVFWTDILILLPPSAFLLSVYRHPKLQTLSYPCPENSPREDDLESPARNHANVGIITRFQDFVPLPASDQLDLLLAKNHSCAAPVLTQFWFRLFGSGLSPVQRSRQLPWEKRSFLLQQVYLVDMFLMLKATLSWGWTWLEVKHFDRCLLVVILTE